jgi:hypothetical protein
MQKFVDNGTVRRLLVTGVAMAAVLLNKKLGLDIGEDQQELVVYLAMTYIWAPTVRRPFWLAPRRLVTMRRRP